jgi:hypothetical protein
LRNELLKELLVHGIVIQNNTVIINDNTTLSFRDARKYYKKKSQSAYDILCDLWVDIVNLLEKRNCAKTSAAEGVDNIFIHALQGLKRLVHLYPGLADHAKIEDTLCMSLCSDINTFSYNVMSKIIEYKLAIEWLTHLISKNLYIRSLLLAYQNSSHLQTEAKGVHGPYSNLDLPMEERVFSWSVIDEEVRGRSRDLRSQMRYTKGLTTYDDPLNNNGTYWREIRNEPYLWGKEGENPYPHRNLLWT